MDDGEEKNMNITSLSRVNDQLNYQRKFLGPGRAVVTIPTMPFQAFDIFMSGTKIKTWELLNLLVSVRSFTQYPAKHTESPNDTLLDSSRLMRDNYVFIVAHKLEISREFHDLKTPKFPLLVEAIVTHIGNGSSRRRYTMKHESMTSPYVTWDVDDVVVSKQTRKPAPFPEWWRSKFGHINKSPKTKFRIPARSDERVFTNECTVGYASLDHNKHTTTNAYVLFCIEALYDRITRTDAQTYETISLADFREGIKSLTVIMHRETNCGDRLLVESWEPRGTVRTVNFQIRTPEGALCCSVSVELYAKEEATVSKL